MLGRRAVSIHGGNMGQHLVCKPCGCAFLAEELNSPMNSTTEQTSADESVERPAPAPAERIAVVCPNCQATLAVRRAYLGKTVQCKQCNQAFVMRDPSQPTTEPATGEGGPISNANYYEIGTDSPRPVSRAEYDRLRSEHAQLQSEHKQLQVESNQHAAKHGHYKLKYKKVDEQFTRVTAELEQIRAHLGAVAPEEVRIINEERQSMDAELHALRETNQVLSAEKSAREQLDSELERRESAIAADRVERDAIAERLRQRDEELDATRATCASLKQQLEPRDDELTTARAELGRSGVQMQEALAELNQTRGALDDLGRASREESDSLRAEVEALRGTLDRAEFAHRSERDRIQADLDALNDQHRQLRDEKESTEQLLNQHRVQSQALVQAHDQLKSDYQSLLDSAQSRAEKVESAPAPPALVAELEALRSQVAHLTGRLDEADRRHLATVQTLRQIGIHPMTIPAARPGTTRPAQSR
jgi:predicted Zn finger-like uncharacterized protein